MISLRIRSTTVSVRVAPFASAMASPPPIRIPLRPTGLMPTMKLRISEISMFQWSIATVCMGGTLEGKLSAAARAGFRAVEIFENDLTFFSGKARDVRAMAEDLGLAIVALQPMRDFEAMPEPARARNFERARRKFDLMDELGTALLCICSNVSDQAIDDPQRAAADLAELADEAARNGFRI